MMTLRDRADILETRGVFLGGPSELFETAGRLQLMTLLGHGLLPGSKVLDVGCGCLRGGYWLIHFLDEGCYCGIEPNVEMLNAGMSDLLEAGLADRARPRFDGNAEFDFSVFGETFDFFVARSIWTHASKEQIEIMLDGFVANGHHGSVFLASYIAAKLFSKDDYKGGGWIGRSHQSDTPGLVHHSLKWIQEACRKRGLVVKEVDDQTFNFGGQTWLAIGHGSRS